MRARLREELRRLWLEPRDPRLLQLGFSLLFLLDMALRVAGDVELRTGPMIGLVLVPVAWVVTLTVPWTRTPEWCRLALLVFDVGLVGLSRLDPVGGSALLVVIPALWLGFAYGVRGAVVTGVSTVLLVMVPGLLYIGVTGINLSRSVTTTVIAVTVSLAIANVIQRVRGGQELIELQRRVGEAILDTVDVGLVLLDGNGRYLTMNRRHHDFMRLAFPAGHRGQAGQLGDVFHEDGETFVQHEDMPTYRATQGEEFDDQLIWVGSDPLTRRALSVSSRVVREESGRFAGAALAYKDVTDFMRALEVKEEFVASVSHELRTPLTSIHGFTSLVLERDDLPDEVRHQLGVVERNVDRLDRLVADLLQTAQVERGLVHLERERTDLAALVRQSHRGRPPRGRGRRADPGQPGAQAPGRDGRPPALRAGRRQPALERRQVHAGRRPHRGRPLGHPRPGRAGRPRHRHRHQRARPQPRLQPVLPHPARRPAVDPGHRPGAEHHQGDRGQPRRPDRGRERGGPRLDLPGPAAPRRPAAAAVRSTAIGSGLTIT